MNRSTEVHPIGLETITFDSVDRRSTHARITAAMVWTQRDYGLPTPFPPTSVRPTPISPKTWMLGRRFPRRSGPASWRWCGQAAMICRAQYSYEQRERRRSRQLQGHGCSAPSRLLTPRAESSDNSSDSTGRYQRKGSEGIPTVSRHRANPGRQTRARSAAAPETGISQAWREPEQLPAVATLNSKHTRTLQSIFERPTRSDIRWSDIESLIVALGGEVSAGSGSRRRVFLVRPAVFHEPHPDPTTDKGAVKNVREFLICVGAKP